MYLWVLVFAVIAVQSCYLGNNKVNTTISAPPLAPIADSITTPTDDHISSSQRRCRQENIESQFHHIIENQCESCHKLGGIAESSDFAMLESAADWIRSPYIIPGYLAKSSLYYRLNGSSGDNDDKNMPMGAEPLSDEELCIIESYIVGIEDLESASHVPDLSFEAKSDSFELLPFAMRIKKIEQLLAADGNNPDSGIFTKLKDARYSLGDYNFARNIPEISNLSTLHLDFWVNGLDDTCRFENWQSRFTWQQFDRFIVEAYGRPLLERDRQLLNELNQTQGLDDAKRFEIGCIATLSSIEFLSQAAVHPSRMTVDQYLNHLAGKIMQRPLTVNEKNVIAKKGSEAIAEVIKSWTDSEQFLFSIADYTQKLVLAGGDDPDRAAIDFDLPAKLAVKLQQNQESYKLILTYDSCGQKNPYIPCDSSSKVGAGILTTRSFLTAHQGPYNLARAGRLVNAFACTTYPIKYKSFDISGHFSMVNESRSPVNQLIDIFADRSGRGFGNGTACYACHGQFGKHAQLFINYDFEGMFHLFPAGLQNPSATPGHSDNGLFTSHYKTPVQAASSHSQFFGESVDTLNAAMEVLTANPAFWECAVKNIIGYYLRLPDANLREINPWLFEAIANRHRFSELQPDFATLVEKTLSDPELLKNFFKGDQP